MSEIDKTFRKHVDTVGRVYGSVSIKGMKADFKYDEPDKALPVVKAATFLQPHDADNWCILGDLYLVKKEWNAAIECFDKALSKNPKSSRAITGKEKALSQTEK